jgi:hypothetical protein
MPRRDRLVLDAAARLYMSGQVAGLLCRQRQHGAWAQMIRFGANHLGVHHQQK